MRASVASSLLAIAALVLLGLPAQARTWHISPDGSGDAPTIQAGVDSASTGDVVELAPGEYTGDGNRDVDFLGKAITVRSENLDPSEVAITPGGYPYPGHRGFVFQSGEGPASILEGVTVKYGYAPYYFLGGALYCEASSPTIRHCHFTDNYSVESAPCVYIASGNPLVTDCHFKDNSTTCGYGGAIVCGQGNVTVLRCHFESNGCEDFGGAILGGLTLTVADCVFIGNFAARNGGAIAFGGTGLIERCMFIGNGSAEGGGISTRGSLEIRECTFIRSRSDGVAGSAIHVYDGGTVTLDRVIIAFGTLGPGLDGEATLTCCDIFGNAGGDWTPNIAAQLGINGNFSADPMFCGDENPEDPYTLFSSSPCLPGNHPQGDDCGVIGARGAGCQAIEVAPQTWASVKARYR
jgi:predicted outer membrane repeat protein